MDLFHSFNSSLPASPLEPLNRVMSVVDAMIMHHSAHFSRVQNMMNQMQQHFDAVFAASFNSPFQQHPNPATFVAANNFDFSGSSPAESYSDGLFILSHLFACSGP